MQTIWIADLRISERTATKIVDKHGISGQQVRDAVVGQRGLLFVWNFDPERGLRAIVRTQVAEKLADVVLYPRPTDAYGDSWWLGSVYPC